MAKVKSTQSGTTITLDVDELLRVVGGYVATELAKKLPKYKEQFDKADCVKTSYKNGKVIIQLLSNCGTILG